VSRRDTHFATRRALRLRRGHGRRRRRRRGLLERLCYLCDRTDGGLRGEGLEAGSPFAGAHRRGSGHGGGKGRK
jgi:hypothetical protein